MKYGVLVRPNLKLFLVVAILILAVQDVVTRGHGNTLVHARFHPVGNEALECLLAQAVKEPTPDLYMRLSDEYERRGNIRRALFFLRRAEQLADREDGL